MAPKDKSAGGKGKGTAGRGKGSKSISKSKRAGLSFPVGRIGRYLKQGMGADTLKLRVGAGAPIYLAAVLEYLTAEILELAGKIFVVFYIMNL